MKSPKLRLKLFAVIAVGSIALAVWVLRSDWHKKSIEIDGVNRQYLFYAPDDYEGELPLLLVFHGFSGDAEGIRSSSKLHELVNEHKFFLAYLDGAPTWRRPTVGRECADVDFFDQLCSKLERELPIDASRIYVAGMSMGGDFVIRLGGVRSERIAAVASQGMITDSAVEAERSFPLMVIVGTEDNRVSPDRFPKVPNSFRERGHIVKVMRPSGVGHRWHVPLNKELWSFLSKHRLQ